jgi:hypothetical protein
VDWVYDDDADWNEDLATEAFQLHQTLLQLATGNAPPDSFYSGKFLLSFSLLASLGLPAKDKQTVLELDTEDARLTEIIRKLKQSIRVLEHAHAVQQSVQSWWNLNRVIRKWKTNRTS